MRIACGLAYDGTNYAGWQWQVNVSTIQETVEKAISQVATHPIRITCAGRTDRGVHASAQVMHFDTDCHRSPETWQSAINYYLPSDIRILWVQRVESDFHARFSAERRTYHYKIYQGSMPWFRAYSWIIVRPLHLVAMQQAAEDLVGEHDFSAFRSAQCQATSPIRHVQTLSLAQQADWLKIEITANAFLQHMVRNIVGVLVEVGKEKRKPDSMSALLMSRDRQQAGITAPPQGLYLYSISYPKPLHFKQNIERIKQISL